MPAQRLASWRVAWEWVLPAPTALDTLLPAGAYDPAATDRNIST